MDKNKHHEVISISTSYHDTAEGFVQHFVKLIGVTIIPHLISFLLFTAVSAATISSFAGLALEKSFFDLGNLNFDVSLILVLLIFVIQLMGAIALVYMVVDRERSTIHGAFEHSLRYMARFLGLALALLLGSAVGLALGAVIMIIFGAVLGFFSIELLNSVFPWLNGIVLSGAATIISVFLIFAPLSLIDNDSKVIASLKHSIALVRGHFWPIAFRLALLYLLVFILSFVLQFIPAVGNTLTVVVVSPFAVLYLYTLYADLVQRKGTA